MRWIFRKIDLALAAKSADEAVGFGRVGGWQEGDFYINAPWSFEIDFDQIRAAGGEQPEDFPTIRGFAHFLGNHGVNASGEASIVGPGVAFPEGLIGFIDEYDAASESAKKPEDAFEVGLGAADPAVAKISELDDRDAGLTGEAIGKIGFASANRAADKIAHGHGMNGSALPEGEVLADPFLDCFHSVEVVEGAVWGNEFNKVAAFTLDHVFFKFSEGLGGDGVPVVLAAAGDAAEGGEGGAGEEFGGVLRIGGEVFEGVGVFDFEVPEGGEDFR